MSRSIITVLMATTGSACCDVARSPCLQERRSASISTALPPTAAPGGAACQAHPPWPAAGMAVQWRAHALKAAGLSWLPAAASGRLRPDMACAAGAPALHAHVHVCWHTDVHKFKAHSGLAPRPQPCVRHLCACASTDPFHPPRCCQQCWSCFAHHASLARPCLAAAELCRRRCRRIHHHAP